MKRAGRLSVLLSMSMAFTMCAAPLAVQTQAAGKLKKIKLEKSTAVVEAGKKIKLKITKKPKNATAKLVWKSSNKAVAKVNKKGVVRGIKPGKATITVKAKAGKKVLKARRKVEVIEQKTVPTPAPEKQNVLITSITAKKSELTINEGEVAKMETEIAPAEATNKKIKYSVSDSNVASVSEDGVITAIAQGECEVSAVTTDGSNKSASMKITVTKKQRPRAIITQDGEVDDMNSLVHMLLYANEIDIRGIIHSSSNAGHWIGVKGAVTPQNAKSSYEEPYRWPGTDWMYEYLDAYAKVYPNLKKHDSSFPTPSYLKKITKVGNIGYPGEMLTSTDGSELIKKELLAEDDRPLYLMAWGGPNTISRALQDIKAEYGETGQWASLYKKITENTIITGCFEQDDTYNDYIAEEWPELAYVNTAQMGATAYGWINAPEDEHKATYKGAWMAKNLEKNHGALMDKYVTWGDGTYLEGELPENQFGFDDSLFDAPTWPNGNFGRYDFISEGDSPCWYMLIDNGLRDKNSVEALKNGGYSGRFKEGRTFGKSMVNSKGQRLNCWTTANDTYVNPDKSEKSISSEWKWVKSIQEDFAARADWCIADAYSKANHAPSIAVTEGIDITAEKGENIKLHAVTSDPDGDYVNTSWTIYKEASTCASAGELALKGADTDIVSFTVPQDAKSGDTIHIIVKAEDDGEHNLVHYQQVIVTVK